MPDRRLLVVPALSILVACGGGGGSAPTTPSPPTPTPTPAPSTFTLRGQVSEGAPFTATKIPGAKVEFVDGANTGKSAVTDGSGNYSMEGLAQGGFTVRASADGFQSVSVGITLTSNLTRDFNLPPSGPRKKFGPGQYRVNSDIAPGRYYSDPAYGCYFERQRGFGGTLGDIIANEFIGFDAQQWIVDIRSSG